MKIRHPMGTRYPVSVLGSIHLKPLLSKEAMEAEIKKAYGVATISRLLKIIGLFCKRAL